MAWRYRFAASTDNGDGEAEPLFDRAQPAGGEDLPYKVELWNEAKEAVDLTLAVTASGSIGYAAFYAATREYPDRYVTLRHKNRIVSRWNGPAN